MYRAPSSAIFTFQPVITPFTGETTGLVARRRVVADLRGDRRCSCDYRPRRGCARVLPDLHRGIGGRAAGAASAPRRSRAIRAEPLLGRIRSLLLLLFLLALLLRPRRAYLPLPFFFFFFLHFFFFAPASGRGFSVGAIALLRGVGRPRAKSAALLFVSSAGVEQRSRSRGLMPADERLVVGDRRQRRRPAGECPSGRCRS